MRACVIASSGLDSLRWRHRSVVDGTWNGVENDVEQDQKDDPADSRAIVLTQIVHGNASFHACFF